MHIDTSGSFRDKQNPDVFSFTLDVLKYKTKRMGYKHAFEFLFCIFRRFVGIGVFIGNMGACPGFRIRLMFIVIKFRFTPIRMRYSLNEWLSDDENQLFYTEKKVNND